ncbi:cytochrome d ubiquinol oxidase subunit II [Kribbella sp. NPDC058245]|uniref:cytochrome d ubiquinol oxidase subunit II n=1 Tax=Kribbella sp. NPDC058245 TaxID=3346399 RepID=UPI0036E04E68
MAYVWIVLMLLCLLMYISLDGYDLGIGIATLYERDERHRREMLEQVAQAWDGNETWLALLAVGLWAGFPEAFGTMLPHAYLPLIVVLLSLIVRGVSVELVSQSPPARGWTKAFGIASLIAALAQGIVFGTLTTQLTVVNGAFSGSPFGAISWYSLLTAATVTSIYLALGHAFLKWKATGELRVRAGRLGTMWTVLASVLGAASLSAADATATPLNLHSPARAIAFAGLLAFAVAGVVMTLATLRPTSRYDALPTAGLVVTIVALAVAIVVARYPVLAPPALTIGNTAAPGATMVFLAVGIGLNVPLILFYNWFSHHAFRGKLDSGPGGRDLPTPGLRSHL